jgi:hypothetical protein
MSSKLKSVLPYISIGLLAALCIYLWLNRGSDQTNVQLELKNQQITAVSKERDSLKADLAKWQRLQDASHARDSLKQSKQRGDSLGNKLKKSEDRAYALALSIKQEQQERGDSGVVTTCSELADTVLAQRATINSLVETQAKTISICESVSMVKDSTIDKMSHLIAVQDVLISDQKDAAALQNSEIKKIKKQSKLRGTIAAIGGGLALVGWLIIALK